MKYMIMMFGDAGTMMETKSPEWIEGMIGFMQDFEQKLRTSGEYAGGHGLADSTQAKTVRMQEGIPVATEGPFAESKESLIGFWIVDVEDEARAIELTSEIVAYIEAPIEVRQVMDEPPEM